MSRFDPFADDTATMAIGEFNVENGRQAVSLYGSLDVTRDQIGLDRARQIAAVLNTVIQALEAVPDLPAVAPVVAGPATKTVKNPFE